MILQYVLHCDSKKDNITNLAEINIPDKPSATGNLTKELKIKIGARVMITTNIDVSDGLMNGVMGMIVNILKDEEEVNVKIILVKFDNSDVGQSAKSQSLYKKVDRNAVPFVPFQASFQINSSSSCTASRLQFPLKLSWAVTIHKCQGLTLDEIVIDMSPNKGKYYPSQAYMLDLVKLKHWMASISSIIHDHKSKCHQMLNRKWIG